MEQERFRNVLKILSIREGVSEEEILKEMEIAIAEGYHNTMKSGNAEAIAMWHDISPDGVPDAARFVSYLAKLIYKDSVYDLS